MRAMTVDAAYLGPAMRRALEIRMRSHVTGETVCVSFLRGSVLEDKNLGFIATACNVLGSWPVAALATLMGGLRFGIECCFPMRRFLPRVIDLLVAGLAGLRANILGGVGGRRTGHRCADGLNVLSRRWRISLAGNKGDDPKTKYRQQY